MNSEFEDTAHLRETVGLGEDALQRGEYLTHEQGVERLQRFLTPSQ